MSDTVLQEVFLGRQPILDRKQQLFAYELLFRSSKAEDGNFASFVDGNQATAMVITHAFTEFSMADALGPYQGFIKVDQGLLFSDLINALPPHSVVLEILETVAQTPEMIARCEQLRFAGYILAVRERPESLDQNRQLLKLAQVIKIDISRVEPARLQQLVTNLKPLGKTLLAEKVESVEQMKLCHDLGFDLFQGYYFARPTVISGKHLQASELALIRLLGLLSHDADIGEIEKVFKQEPVLTVNLLRLTNSVGSGMATRITSLRHAITILGRRQLQRWLQLLVYANHLAEGQGPNPLMQLAAARGRQMELLCIALDPKPEILDLCDSAYMTGLFSLLEVLINLPMQDIVKELPLQDEVLEALATPGQGGQLSRLLAALCAGEAGRYQEADERFAELGISPEKLTKAQATAFLWASHIDRISLD